jgi:hypothetical protein
MTYYKYTQFLMPEDGLEYDVSLKPGSSAPFSGIYYCEVCGAALRRFIRNHCRYRNITPMRRHRVRFAGA